MTLAVHGGTPLRSRLFPAYRTIGAEEKAAVARVMDSGLLSQYLGAWHEDFYGGPEVRALEQEWARFFGVKHAMAVNSCTSGLYCAVGAAGIGPGDEVIVSPYTMSASAVAPLIYQAVPVFADIEPEYFCLDLDSIRQRLTPRTRAIIVVDIFGQPYAAQEINRFAREHGLCVIEDAAQAPGARYHGRFAGTLGDIGVYSLNYHKHIHCGEGGVVVTNDDRLAERVRLIRNHAESVVGPKGETDLVNMVGFNFRMTELEAAIARCQLAKLPGLLAQRQKNCQYLARALEGVGAMVPAPTRPGAEHAYYVHPFLFDAPAAGVTRETFIQAVRAELAPTQGREREGVKVNAGYVKPIYLQPMFQQRLAFGRQGRPFNDPAYDGEVSYERGLCPVTERLHEKEFVAHELMHAAMSRQDLDDVAAAFHKVWDHRQSL